MNLYYYEDATMKEIGLILGVVESRISQIHTSAMLHLRAELNSPTRAEELTREHQGTESFRNSKNRLRR
jgi:RNA polymerase sigma factor FliA